MPNEDCNLEWDIYYKILTAEDGTCKLEFFYDTNHNDKDLDLLPYLTVTKRNEGDKNNSISTMAPYIRFKVKWLIGKCLILKDKEYLTPNSYVIGKSPNLELCFDKERIEIFKNEVYSLLQKVKPIMYFEDLRTLKNGETWTNIKQPIQWLMALANAAGFLDFDEDINAAHTDNPKLILLYPGKSHIKK